MDAEMHEKRCNMFMLFRDVSLMNEKSIPIAKVQMISISYISCDVMVYTTDDDLLVLKEYFNDPDPALHAQISLDVSNLTIRHGDRKMLSMVRGYIEVFLPKKYFGTLNVQTVSGRIDARGKLALDELNLSSTSGKIILDDATAGTAVLSTVSGSIGAGILRAKGNLHTTSGSIRVESAVGEGVFRSVSGSIQVSYETVLGNIKASSTSGRIRLSVPAKHAFLLHTHSVSGSVQVGFPSDTLMGNRHSISGQVGDNPHDKIELATVSGRIELVSE